MDGRAWLLCTKWTGDEANKLVQRAVNLLHYSGFDIELNKEKHSGYGSAELNKNGSLYYEVGIKEI